MQNPNVSEKQGVLLKAVSWVAHHELEENQIDHSNWVILKLEVIKVLLILTLGNKHELRLSQASCGVASFIRNRHLLGSILHLPADRGDVHRLWNNGKSKVTKIGRAPMRQGPVEAGVPSCTTPWVRPHLNQSKPIKMSPVGLCVLLDTFS